MDLFLSNKSYFLLDKQTQNSPFMQINNSILMLYCDLPVDELFAHVNIIHLLAYKA